ncbi:MAG: glycosyltransferase family 2 protein [Muribaculaceae bacterium]|nr:glycosyltransferase family 2 protein [Muribaculaceae bacterium]
MKLAIVVPCFNEVEVLPLSAPRLREVVDIMVAQNLISAESFILFVNDGSRDATWTAIRGLHAGWPAFRGLDLSKNVGQQNATIAGMELAVDQGADAVVTIDADLQDNPEDIIKMVRLFLEGNDVVYGVHSARDTDSFMKRFTADAFYKLQRKLGTESVYNHSEFRLMSARVIREFAKYGERNMYLRGIIPLIGYDSAILNCERHPRLAGTTKYSYRKLTGIALDAITSFSEKPIFMILTLGIIFVAIAVGIGIYVAVSLWHGIAVHGWASTMLSIWLVGGLNLLATGLVGTYVGKIYIESKHRPRYHIKDKI